MHLQPTPLSRGYLLHCLQDVSQVPEGSCLSFLSWPSVFCISLIPSPLPTPLLALLCHPCSVWLVIFLVSLTPTPLNLPLLWPACHSSPFSCLFCCFLRHDCFCCSLYFTYLSTHLFFCPSLPHPSYSLPLSPFLFLPLPFTLFPFSTFPPPPIPFSPALSFTTLFYPLSLFLFLSSSLFLSLFSLFSHPSLSTSYFPSKPHFFPLLSLSSPYLNPSLLFSLPLPFFPFLSSPLIPSSSLLYPSFPFPIFLYLPLSSPSSHPFSSPLLPSLPCRDPALHLARPPYQYISWDTRVYSILQTFSTVPFFIKSSSPTA